MTNLDLSQTMQQFARDQERRGANLFQVRAFRTAAGALARLDTPLEAIFARGGRASLEALPGVGKSVAYTLEGVLKGETPKSIERPDRGREPLTLLSTLPGIGQRLAEQLQDQLGVHSLESLVAAGADGRLEAVGVTGKRLVGLMAAARARLATKGEAPTNEPSLRVLLDVDEAFRRRAGSSFERDGWRLRVHFADTALAHRRGTTRDWVTIDFARGEVKGQRTVVTELEGDLSGERVVRGREAEHRVGEAA